MMRYILLLIPLMLIGCISLGGQLTENGTQNVSLENQTQNNASTTQQNISQNISQNMTQNITPNASIRFNASGFSFDYPSDMKIETKGAATGGIITLTHMLDGTTGELMALSYVNVTKAYGQNREKIWKSNPTKAAADYLAQDKQSDSMGFFMKASYLGEITTFAIGRDIYAAEMPFSLKLNSGTTYAGYALTFYIPERSLIIDVRIMALDPEKAKMIRDNLLLSLRLE